jgi:hypothetical protein
MRWIKSLSLFVVLPVLLLLTCSWGFLVHRTVHQLAVYQLPSEISGFFYTNMEYLVYNAPRPDTRRNQDSTEAPRHFVDLEAFGPDAAHKMPMNWQAAVKRYSRDSLEKYGYVPYHVVYMQEKLTDAFRVGKKDSILFYAADLAHYIGDANVPLHSSINYDGQLSGQKGMHSLWESTVPELVIGSYWLYTPHKARYLKNPAAAIWGAVRRSASLVPDVLRIEKEVSAGFVDSTKYRTRTSRGREYKSYSTAFARAYAAALGSMVNDQLLRSSEMIADFWYTSWVDAGKPDLGRLLPTGANAKLDSLNREKQLYKANQLIPNKLLISRKTGGAEQE